MSQNSKRIIVVILIVVSLLVLVFLYYLVLHPVLAPFLFHPDEHCGIDYYENLSYLEYENGKTFHDFINSDDMLIPGQIKNFYHVDRKIMDNPIHGKAFDVFALDILPEEIAYSDFKLKTEQDYTYLCGMTSYNLYLVGTDSSQNGNTMTVTFIALCDKDCIIRYILVTDVDLHSFVPHLGSALYRYTSLTWE